MGLETKDSTTDMKTTSKIEITAPQSNLTTEIKTKKMTTTFTTIASTTKSTAMTAQPGINSVRHVILFHKHTYENCEITNIIQLYNDY